MSERSQDPLTKLRLSVQARPERRGGPVLPAEGLHCHPKRYGGWAKAGGPGYSEKEELVTNCDRLRNLQHSSVNPMAFTEQGVAMLSTVLRSGKAIRINIEIMRAFARYRGPLREK